MPKLLYSTICSLDGYIADRDGDYGWAVPDEAVVRALNDELRTAGTYLYGQRMYQEMTGWENDPAAAAQSPESAAFAEIWRRARKVVFSTTLSESSTTRTTIERELTREVVDRLRAESAGDLYVDGPNLTATAFRLGVVDEVHLVLAPVAVGAGKPWYPHDVRLHLDLMAERRFANGMVQLRYRVRDGGPSVTQDPGA